MAESPVDLSASFWTSNFAIGLWERPKTPNYYDFGISGSVHDSQNQYYVSLETPGYFKKFKKNPKSVWIDIMLINRNIFEKHSVFVFEKRRAPNNPEDPS